MAAHNQAAWHDCSMRALGLRPRWTEWWWTCATPAPSIFFTAVSLRPPNDPGGEVGEEALAAVVDEMRAHVADEASGHLSVCDSWDVLDLTATGLRRRSTGRWAARPAIPLAPEAPPEALLVEPVRSRADLMVFEQTLLRGFGARMAIAPFDIHGPEILDDPAMHLFLGRREGRPVATSMAFVTDGALGIYGVATVSEARGHGFATAMTRAALAVAPDRPATLQPTPAALSLYQRLGFETIGRSAHWS